MQIESVVARSQLSVISKDLTAKEVYIDARNVTWLKSVRASNGRDCTESQLGVSRMTVPGQSLCFSVQGKFRHTIIFICQEIIQNPIQPLPINFTPLMCETFLPSAKASTSIKI